MLHQILPGDSSFELGAMLLRLMSPGELSSKSYLGSVLRLMATSKSVANDLPNYRCECCTVALGED